MMIIIAFSGGNTPKPKQASPPPLTVADPNNGRIEDYRRRIEEQTEKLNQEREQWAKERSAQSVAALTETSGSPYGNRSYDSDRSYTPAPEKSWIEEDREKRDYQSLYSSNLALSYRERQTNETAPLAALERALANSQPVVKGKEENAEPMADDADQKGKVQEINQAVGPKFRFFEGSYMETVLTNRLDGAFSGPVSGMTTADIYSHNGQHVLIPAGSRVLGEVKRVEAFSQERLAVVFHRLIMPDGYAVSLDQFRGLNQIGETGLRDQINHHYLQIFGVSVAIGAIAGLSQANTRSGTDVSSADAYRQGVAASLSQSSLQILDRYLNVLPTITIREGQRVKVYLTNDLILPAYENHRIPNDL
jgi:type IV secretion system protein VirB10